MKKILLLSIVVLALSSHVNSQTALVGMTSEGGNQFGTIFGISPGGTSLLQQYNWEGNAGIRSEGSLVEATNGKFYGMTYGGGANDEGAIFEFDYSTNTYTKKIDLSEAIGMYPHGSLIMAANGKLYGMIAQGGANFVGVIFEYDYSSNTYTKKIDMLSANGSNPHGSLIQAANGKLYGMTNGGGANGQGVIFEYDYITNTYIKKIDLTIANGSKPWESSLMQASNGKLYGLTREGGTNNVGVIFEYDYSTNIYTKKFDFSTLNGINPRGSLMEATNGKLYGMTWGGGANNVGAIFEYDYTTNIYTKKIDLTPINGGHFSGSLFQVAIGKLCGAALGGANNGAGVIFEYDYITNTYTKKIDISSANGQNPNGTLVQAANGKLYGITNQGGASNEGVIFEYNYPANTYTKKIDLGFGVNGDTPQGSLVQASNGKLYGMTQIGGINNLGVVFEYDYATNIYNKKFDLDGVNGKLPSGSMIQAANGKLYGMTTESGGINGVIFEYDYTANIYVKKINLSSANGYHPFGSLMQASNGKLYGMTSGGGVNGAGVIFEYDYTTNIYTKKIDLSASIGSSPHGSLIQAANGKLYGMTQYGGAKDSGVVFEYDYFTNTYTKKIDLSSSVGWFPLGSLIQAGNGKLYGLTGGTNNIGVIFEYDYTTNTCTKKFNFSTANGRNPFGSLMQASNGKLYGMTRDGGVNNEGVVFEYDYVTNTYTKKFNFSGTDGKGPYYGQLIEINTTIQPQTITTFALPASSYCVGANVNVSFTGTGSFTSGNIFTAQLSDASGNFSAPTDIGTLTGITGGTINALIPASIPVGIGYRIRVVSSNPVVTGSDNGTNISINANPVPTISGSLAFCNGASTTLNAGVFASYNWSTGATTQTISINTAGTFTVTVTSGGGCTGSAFVTTTISANPTPLISGSLYFCSGGSTILDAGTFASYNWSTGASTQTISVNTAGTFTVTVTNSAGCSGSTSVITTINPLPTVSFSGLAGYYNVNASPVILTGSPPGGTFSGPGISGNIFTPSAAGIGGPYTITYSYTNANGCSSTVSHQTTVVVCALPAQPNSITAIGAVGKVCPGDSKTYKISYASGATSYTWAPPAGGVITSGQGTGQVTVNYTAGFTATGLLSVVANNSCGNSPASTLTITRNTPAVPGIITGLASGVCSSIGVPYSVVNTSGISYNWSFNVLTATVVTGQGTNVITADYNGAYTSGQLSVTASNSCGTSPARVVTVNAVPATPASITGPTSVCANQFGVPYSIVPVATATSYTWTGMTGSHISDGVTTSIGTVLTTTSASVTVNFGYYTGKLNLKANNACGLGTNKTLIIGFNCREEEQLPYNLNVTCYPVPATSELTVSFESAQPQINSIRIIDMVGKTLLQQNNNSTVGENKFTFDIASFSRGIYFLEVVNGNEKNIQKIVLE